MLDSFIRDATKRFGQEISSVSESDDAGRTDRSVEIGSQDRQPMAQESMQSKPQAQRTSIMDEVDEELRALLNRQLARIKVVGVGGAGNNTINRITEIGVKGAETVAVNTDAQDLLYTNADKKVLIGKDTTKGMGAGSIPKIGEEAARENETELKL